MAVDADARAELEAGVRARCEAGRFDEATADALRAYGPEVYGYLLAMARDETLADDAFALLSERLWTTLPRFAWSCTLRSWVYLLGRHALADVRRDGSARKRGVPLSDANISALAAQIRTATASFLRTETRSELQKLRETLPEDDQTLLVLRVDKGMTWPEIAVALSGDASTVDTDALEREAARLRKRFQLVKERFTSMARRQGLVGQR